MSAHLQSENLTQSSIESKVLIDITQYKVVLKLLQSDNICNQYFLDPDLERNDYLYGFVSSQSP